MSRKLICFGDLCADIVLRASNLPLAGQDSVVEELRVSSGGGAANCAICASRLGVRAELLGVVGRDSFGERLIAELTANAVGTAHVRKVETPTGMVIIAVDQSGERTMFSYRGANACDYGAVSDNLLRAGDCLYVSGYSFQTDHSRSTAIELLRLAEAAGATRALDPSYVFARDARASYREALSKADLLFPNEEEARLLSGSPAVEEAAAIIQGFGPRVVVVTLGGRGCYVHSDEVSTLVPTPTAVPAVDTTGAGDAFCAGFLSGIMRGMDLVSSARAGHEAAADVIGIMGSHRTSS